MRPLAGAAFLAAFFLAPVGHAQDVAVPVAFTFNGVEMRIEQSPLGDLARLSEIAARAPECTQICVAAQTVRDDIPTITERDVIAFIETDVANGNGLLLDSRAPEVRATGAIATSVNLPAAVLAPENPYLNQILVAMGARSFNDVLNFADALPVVVYDDGPLSQDAQTMIRNLIEVGYPTDKIKYYRGGLLVWTALGLSVEETTS